MSVRPVASHGRTPLGSGIMAASQRCQEGLLSQALFPTAALDRELLLPQHGLATHRDPPR